MPVLGTCYKRFYLYIQQIEWFAQIAETLRLFKFIYPTSGLAMTREGIASCGAAADSALRTAKGKVDLEACGGAKGRVARRPPVYSKNLSHPFFNNY